MLIALIGNSAESMLNFRASLIRRAVSVGNCVAAFAPDYTIETREAVKSLGASPFDFPLNRGGSNPAADLASLIALKRALSDLRPHAVLCYFIKPAIYGNLAARWARVPRRIIMLEGLGYGFAEVRRRSLGRLLMEQAIRMLLKASASQAEITLVLNEQDKELLIQQVGVDPCKVHNMGGIGVEIEKFTPWPVRDKAKVFVMAARLIAEKGVHQFVEAAQRIRLEDSSIRFVLLGDVDDNPNSLKYSQIAAWRDAGIIEWPGRVSNIQDWLKQADVFVLPSYYREGVPRSTQEAMALGRPVITTDHVGCRDTVNEGVNGFLVPPRDVEALIHAMRQLMETPGLAQRMGVESRRLAEERFDAANADTIVLNHLTAAHSNRMHRSVRPL